MTFYVPRHHGNRTHQNTFLKGLECLKQTLLNLDSSEDSASDTDEDTLAAPSNTPEQLYEYFKSQPNKLFQSGQFWFDNIINTITMQTEQMARTSVNLLISNWICNAIDKPDNIINGIPLESVLAFWYKYCTKKQFESCRNFLRRRITSSNTVNKNSAFANVRLQQFSQLCDYWFRNHACIALLDFIYFIRLVSDRMRYNKKTLKLIAPPQINTWAYLYDTVSLTLNQQVDKVLNGANVEAELQQIFKNSTVDTSVIKALDYWSVPHKNLNYSIIVQPMIVPVPLHEVTHGPSNLADVLNDIMKEPVLPDTSLIPLPHPLLHEKNEYKQWQKKLLSVNERKIAKIIFKHLEHSSKFQYNAYYVIAAMAIHRYYWHGGLDASKYN